GAAAANRPTDSSSAAGGAKRSSSPCRRQRRVMTRKPNRASSVRVLVLPPRAGLGGLGFRRPLEQEAVVGRHERVGGRHGVGVVDGPVLARERDPAWVLAQPVLEL